MLSPALDLAARTVLGQFGLGMSAIQLRSLGNHGGFSGAALWRVESPSAVSCLRAWPPDGISSARLHTIHQLMATARQAGLGFVPAVYVLPDGSTCAEQDGRLWELTSWQPGRADFHERPEPARLDAACTALARLHGAWSVDRNDRGPCPAVRRRLKACRQWLDLRARGWRPEFSVTDLDPVEPWARKAWTLLTTDLETIAHRLAPWLDRDLAVQPCLCDIWHDHVLFEGPEVAGIVDYGSVKMDHVAVDLARLLGSLVGDDQARRSAGMEAYARLRPLTAEERMLVDVLDETGTLLGAANWLRWLYAEDRHYEDRAAVARRLATLVERMEEWEFESTTSGTSKLHG